MAKNKNFTKKPEILGYRTPDKFKSLVIRRNTRTIAMTARPRCLGGHH